MKRTPMRERELISHRTFERWCQLKALRVQPIRPAASSRPDYLVRTGRKRCTVELKQLEPNPEDQKQRNEAEEKGQTSWK